jgi:hypothetical protein
VEYQSETGVEECFAAETGEFSWVQHRLRHLLIISNYFLGRWMMVCGKESEAILSAHMCHGGKPLWATIRFVKTALTASILQPHYAIQAMCRSATIIALHEPAVLLDFQGNQLTDT